MELIIKFDTVKTGWPIAYIEWSQVIVFQRFCEDWFCLRKQCILWWNAALLGISSCSSLFTKVPVFRCLVLKGFNEVLQVYKAL